VSAPAASDAVPAAAPAAPVRARPTARAVAWRFAAVAGLVALDLWSKSAVFAWMERLEAAGGLVLDRCGGGHQRHPLAGEWLTFMLSLNPGAAFGQLHSIPYVLVGGRVAAALFLTWLVLRTGPGRRALTTALVLILAGALGNLYDNLLRARDLPLDRFYPPARYPFGPVRDFIDVYFGVWSWHFPTFNVADSCITVGAALLLLGGLFGPRRAAA
jgi:signal peptidase II